MPNENVHPIFANILDSFGFTVPRETIPTSEGDKTVPEIMDHLTWCSYKANRDNGCSHEELVRNGIGNEAMRLKYDQEAPKPAVTVVYECKEPWIYWWALSSTGKDLYDKIQQEPDKIKEIWQRERIHALQDYEWVELAEKTVGDTEYFEELQTKEIWRQVYRIASERI